jgi:NitT/TauT family transport system permease protein
MRFTSNLVTGTVSILVGLAIWQLLATTGLIDTFFFSSPLQVGQQAVIELTTPRFWGSLWASAVEFGVGFGLAAVVGIVLGLIAGSSKPVAYLIDPWLNFFYSLPRIALVPLLVLWFGIGFAPIVVIVFLGAFFEIVLNTEQGARETDPRLVNVARIYRASSFKAYTSIVIPSSIGLMLVGLRLGLSRGILGVIIGELFAGSSGLGQDIAFASAQLNAGRVIFVTLVLALAALALTSLMRKIERAATPWRHDLGVMQ